MTSGREPDEVTSALADGPAAEARVDITARHETLEQQVLDGVRDARTLVAIPPDIVRRAKLTFPVDAFGKPKPW